MGSSRTPAQPAVEAAAPTVPEADLVTIRGVVRIPPTANTETARVEIRYADSEGLAYKAQPDARGVYWAVGLFPGEEYIVRCVLAMGPAGPWHCPQERVIAEPGGVYRVDFAPFAGAGQLRVAGSPGTPDYLFALFPEGTPAPTSRRQYLGWFEEEPGRRSPVYLLMATGAEAYTETALPAGRYLAVVSTNDRVAGSRSTDPFSEVIEITSGGVTRIGVSPGADGFEITADR